MCQSFFVVFCNFQVSLPAPTWNLFPKLFFFHGSGYTDLLLQDRFRSFLSKAHSEPSRSRDTAVLSQSCSKLEQGECSSPLFTYLGNIFPKWLEDLTTQIPLTLNGICSPKFSTCFQHFKIPALQEVCFVFYCVFTSQLFCWTGLQASIFAHQHILRNPGEHTEHNEFYAR